MLVVLLLGVLFLREPRLARVEDFYLRWLLKHSQPHGAQVPLTVVEIGRDPLMETGENKDPVESSRPRSNAVMVSPLELALFLQSVLEFQPGVVAFENVLKWRESEKDQEQVFIDQAMRVPKLLLASELTTTPDPDDPGQDVQPFTQVTGKRGSLPTFSGIARQPNEDMRLISTAGFVNLPEEVADDLHVPLLFQYRGEVIPSFALQAILLWLRVTPAEVKIEIGSQILLPQGRKIPIGADGTVLIHLNATRKAQRISLNELLLAAQQRDSKAKVAPEFEAIRDQIVLARTPVNPLSPPDVFAATIATIQSNRYVHRMHWAFDCVVVLAVTAFSGRIRRFSKVDLIVGTIAFTAAYCLLALAVIARFSIWLPGLLPLGAVWLVAILSLFLPEKAGGPPPEMSAVPPPIA